jgi:hypothetical protein
MFGQSKIEQTNAKGFKVFFGNSQNLFLKIATHTLIELVGCLPRDKIQ